LKPVEREWLAQARRGVIELCVLALIARTPQYGYQLATALGSLGKPLAASEGTLYPLLRRLQREGLVEATWQESRDGPPRKYYHLSEAGARLLDSQLAEWDQLTEAVGHLRSE
jgi:PadR family transcriptional regulator, regulatory protein PadR